MKKFILPIALLTTLFTACKSDEKEDLETSRQLLLTPDTAALYRNNINADVAKEQENYNTPKADVAVATKTIIKRVYIPAEKPAPVQAPVATATPVLPPVAAAPAPDVTPAPATMPAPVETAAIPAPAEVKKKGISDAAKGAAIGGVGGAVAGAVIGKNGKGAIIGGVIGAAGGYILGRQKDKKTGRADHAIN